MYASDGVNTVSEEIVVEVIEIVEVPEVEPVENVSVNVSELNITEVNITEINITEVNITNVSIINVTNATVVNVTEEQPVERVEINKPVKWEKRIVVENNESVDKTINIGVELPEYADNISVVDLTENKIIDKDEITIKDVVKPAEKAHQG